MKWRLYLGVLRGQWRLPVVRLFCLALAVACCVNFGITLLGERFVRLFDQQAQEVLAADLVLESSTVLSDVQAAIIRRSPLRKARTLRFITMARAGERSLLSAVKAVSAGYPLLGRLQVAEQSLGAPVAVRRGPRPGTVWVEEQVLHELGLAPGASLQIGEQDLRIDRVLLYEPDRGHDFYSLTPRIMMHWQDVQAAGVLAPGSRLRYRYLFAGQPAALAVLRGALAGALQLNQEFITVEQDNRRLFVHLQQARRFLHLSALAAILLGAVAVALASFQYTVEMTRPYAILRCLGLSAGALRTAVLLPFAVFALLALVLGLGLGALLHWLLLASLSGLLPGQLPAAGLRPAALSIVLALFILAGFAGPFLRGLWRTPPRLLLHRIPQAPRGSGFACLILLPGAAALVYLGTREVLLGSVVLLVLAPGLLLAGFVLHTGLGGLLRLAPRLGLAPRLALRMLGAFRLLVIVQVLAVAGTVLALLLVQTLRSDLLRSWQGKIPEDAPNFFAVNLLPGSLSRFQALLREQGIAHSPPYPVVRARLAAVRGVAIRQYEAQGREHESLDRDLALTWSDQLPHDNAIVAGAWHEAAPVTPAAAEVSVEQGIAEALDIRLHDQLTFAAAAQRVTARVTSIRTVQWESFTPNFYMIFRPGSLRGMPYTGLQSMRIEAQQRSLLPPLAEAFPGVSFLDVDFLLQRIRRLIDQLGNTVNIILWLALLSGFLVFAASEMILRRGRGYSVALCKALGASSAQVQGIFRLQLLLVGASAGLLAWVLNALAQWLVVNWYIEGPWVFNPAAALCCLLGAPLAVYLAGYLSLRRYSRAPVSGLLAEG